MEHVQAFAQRPAILETGEEVEGVVVKGLGADVGVGFLARALREGRLPDWSPEGGAMELLVSGLQARALGLSPGQRVRLLLADARGELRPRVFTVVGVYETGLQEFDGEFVFCALHHLQELSGWGIKARMRLSDPLVGDVPGMRGDRCFGNGWSGSVALRMGRCGLEGQRAPCAGRKGGGLVLLFPMEEKRFQILRG